MRSRARFSSLARARSPRRTALAQPRPSQRARTRPPRTLTKAQLERLAAQINRETGFASPPLRASTSTHALSPPRASREHRLHGEYSGWHVPASTHAAHSLPHHAACGCRLSTLRLCPCRPRLSLPRRRLRATPLPPRSRRHTLPCPLIAPPSTISPRTRPFRAQAQPRAPPRPPSSATTTPFPSSPHPCRPWVLRPPHSRAQRRSHSRARSTRSRPSSSRSSRRSNRTRRRSART